MLTISQKVTQAPASIFFTHMYSKYTINMPISPPSSICFYSRQEKDIGDDHSELTLDSGEYITSQVVPLDFKLSADPYFYYTMDERNGNPTKDKDQEIMQLKMQIARQQERIEELSSNLQNAECENELLKAENGQLVNELTLPTMETNSISSKKNHSHQQVLFDVMRKSFKNYIKDHRQETRKDNNKSDNSRQMNEDDIYQQSPLLHKVPTKISFSESTATTMDLSTESSSSQEESHNQQYNNGLEISHQSGSTWSTTYNKGIEAKCNLVEVRKQAARSRRQTLECANLKNIIDAEFNRDRRRDEANQELLVGFGAQRRGRRRSIM